MSHYSQNFLICSILTILASCIPQNIFYDPNVGYDQDLLRTYEQLEQAKQEGAKRYAPELMAEAEHFFAKSKHKAADGKNLDAKELYTISQIKAKHARSVTRIANINKEINNQRKLLMELNTTKSVHESELSHSVVRLEHLKDKIAVSKGILSSSSLDNIDKANELLDEAKNLHADIVLPELYRNAEQKLREAEYSLASEQYDPALELSKQAIELAAKTLEAAKQAYKSRAELTEKLTPIYGADVELTSDGVNVVFSNIFAPRGESIIFEAYPSIDALIEVLKEHAELDLSLYIYSNDFATENMNLDLTNKQAEILKNYLLSNGIAQERLARAEGLGSGVASGMKVDSRRVLITLNIETPAYEELRQTLDPPLTQKLEY